MKDTCKQAIFWKDTRRATRVVDLWTAGDQDEGELEFFNNGLVQAARQFWKKIVDKMQGGGFELSEADPCILYKEDEKGVSIIIIYIDDMLIIGKEEAIHDAIKVLQGHFQVKDPMILEDYLGV